MLKSSSDYIQRISPITAVANAMHPNNPNQYIGYKVEDCRYFWSKPNNSKKKTLRTHRKGK